MNVVVNNKNGKFQPIDITITAHSREELEALVLRLTPALKTAKAKIHPDTLNDIITSELDDLIVKLRDGFFDITR